MPSIPTNRKQMSQITLPTHPFCHTNHRIQTHTSIKLNHINPIDFYNWLSRAARKESKEIQMAGFASSALTIPSFTGLKVGPSATKSCAVTKVASFPAVTVSAKASLKEVGVVAVTIAASAILASNALAIEVLLGSSDGGLEFVPKEFSVTAGEKIVFKNNAGFPHNVVFEEDEVPSGVDASKISMKDEDLLNSAGETYVVTLNVKGSYSFYCAPHQGAGMVGKLTVN